MERGMLVASSPCALEQVTYHLPLTVAHLHEVMVIIVASLPSSVAKLVRAQPSEITL